MTPKQKESMNLTTTGEEMSFARTKKSMNFREIYPILKKLIKQGYGKKCKSYAEGCPLCEAYRVLDWLKEAGKIEKEIEEGKW